MPFNCVIRFQGRKLPANSEKEVFDHLKITYREPALRNCWTETSPGDTLLGITNTTRDLLRDLFNHVKQRLVTHLRPSSLYMDMVKHRRPWSVGILIRGLLNVSIDPGPFYLLKSGHAPFTLCLLNKFPSTKLLVCFNVSHENVVWL